MNTRDCPTLRIMAMVFNATLNNISVISWRSILLMEETGVVEENHRPVASHWQTLSLSNFKLKHKLHIYWWPHTNFT